MKKMRVLVATVGAALAIGMLPAPAQASHHCTFPPVIDDETGVVYTAWVVCENYHDPGNIVAYVICRLKGAC